MGIYEDWLAIRCNRSVFNNIGNERVLDACQLQFTVQTGFNAPANTITEPPDHFRSVEFAIFLPQIDTHLMVTFI